MQDKLVFGKTLTPTQPQEAACAFQVMVVERDGRVTSAPCQEKPMVNGWCLRHQHTQKGLDEGARLGYRSVEIPAAFVIIGQGEQNWLAYFERTREPGLATVMSHLKSLV